MGNSTFDLLAGRTTTVRADLGPLPDVKESDSETAWQLFLKLQEQQPDDFPPTQPAPLPGELPPAAQSLTVQQVMAEARRLNRVCPKDGPWQRMCALLAQVAGSQPPAPILPPESLSTPQLVKRTRVRDQVEWCEQHGQLPLVYAFLRSLPEEDWTHIRG